MSKDQNNQAVELLKEAIAEINHLREMNARMSARLQMFDDVKMILQSNVPMYGLAESSDCLDEINRFIHQQEQLSDCSEA